MECVPENDAEESADKIGDEGADHKGEERKEPIRRLEPWAEVHKTGDDGEDDAHSECEVESSEVENVEGGENAC